MTYCGTSESDYYQGTGHGSRHDIITHQTAFSIGSDLKCPVFSQTFIFVNVAFITRLLQLTHPFDTVSPIGHPDSACCVGIYLPSLLVACLITMCQLATFHEKERHDEPLSMHGPVAASVCGQGHCDRWTVKLGDNRYSGRKGYEQAKGGFYTDTRACILCRNPIRESVIGITLHSQGDCDGDIKPSM